MASDQERVKTKEGSLQTRPGLRGTSLPGRSETSFAFLLELLSELRGGLALTIALCCVLGTW